MELGIKVATGCVHRPAQGSRFCASHKTLAGKDEGNFMVDSIVHNVCRSVCWSVSRSVGNHFTFFYDFRALLLPANRTQLCNRVSGLVFYFTHSTHS